MPLDMAEHASARRRDRSVSHRIGARSTNAVLKMARTPRATPTPARTQQRTQQQGRPQPPRPPPNEAEGWRRLSKDAWKEKFAAFVRRPRDGRRALQAVVSGEDAAGDARGVGVCVEIKILRRVRCDACSMAWRCRFITARPSQDGRVIAEK